MLCQHLGFRKTDKNAVVTLVEGIFGRGHRIATGDLICYKKKSSGTSCCVNLAPSTTKSDVRMPYVKCKYHVYVMFQIQISEQGWISSFSSFFQSKRSRGLEKIARS